MLKTKQNLGGVIGHAHIVPNITVTLAVNEVGLTC